MARASRHRGAPGVGSIVGDTTAVALLAAGAVHAVWATGSSFPFETRSALNDAVVGRQASPRPADCVAVAVVLATAAGAVTIAGRHDHRLARLVAAGVAAGFAIRAALGFAGRTRMLVPGSESATFVRLDRRVYAPLCALLAAGAATAAR